MHANNEVRSRQPIAELAALARATVPRSTPMRRSRSARFRSRWTNRYDLLDPGRTQVLRTQGVGALYARRGNTARPGAVRRGTSTV